MFFAPHLKVVQIALPIVSPLSCDVLLVKDITNNYCWLIVYRPRHDIPVEETRKLHNAIDALLAVNNNTTVLSDLNYRGIEWLHSEGPSALDAISYEFLELCTSWDLTQVVTEPIRQDKCLDIILTPKPENFHSVTVQSPVLTSDHDLILCKWTSRSISPVCKVSRRNFTRANYQAMFILLKSLDWCNVFAACRTVINIGRLCIIF